MRNKIFSLLAVVAVVLTSGCYSGGATSVSGYQPVVDIQSSPAVKQRSYSQDLNECQMLAQQRSPYEQGAKSALGGAAVGAATGAIIGAFTGNPGAGAALGAGVGGVGGAAVGGYQGVDSQESIVTNCLRGRGWNVLGK